MIYYYSVYYSNNTIVEVEHSGPAEMRCYFSGTICIKMITANHISRSVDTGRLKATGRVWLWWLCQSVCSGSCAATLPRLFIFLTQNNKRGQGTFPPPVFCRESVCLCFQYLLICWSLTFILFRKPLKLNTTVSQGRPGQRS